MMRVLTHFNRPNPVAWLFFLGAFAVTVGLGSWQVERLKWKEGLIAEIARANGEAPLTALPKEKSALEAQQFRRVKLRGRWVADTEFHIVPRYFKGKMGYAIIAPFTLADGRIVLVNRGWVPSEKKLPEKRPETRVRGAATIEGLIRTGVERSRFTPANKPEKNIWFDRDVAAMAESAKLGPVVPAMVDVVGTQDVAHLPVPSDGTIRLRNEHLSYIVTWYLIALGILVIFITYHRKKA